MIPNDRLFLDSSIAFLSSLSWCQHGFLLVLSGEVVAESE